MDALERDMYVKNPEGHCFWILNAALYGLQEGARNWYDRYHRHTIRLGFVASYHYRDGDTEGCKALHVDNALMADNEKFYSKVITPLLSQFCISKVEKGTFKFLGMKVVQSSDFYVSISQDTKAIKELLAGVVSLTEEKKAELLK